MKTLLTIFVLTFFVNIGFAQNDNASFNESMNADLLRKLNLVREEKGLPALKYYSVMQNTLDQVADGLKGNFCHCYGNSYVTESLYQANSVDAVIADMRSTKKKKNNPALNKKIRMITVGISDDKDGYYYAIRTF